MAETFSVSTYEVYKEGLMAILQTPVEAPRTVSRHIRDIRSLKGHYEVMSFQINPISNSQPQS